MARIRTVKPEFWTSAQVMECSPMARLLFIGMWNFADDAGRMAYSPKTLKAQIYPSDDITSADIERMIVELSSNGLILLYSAEGKEFISITGWHHQKIDKPKKSTLPDPFGETSSTLRREVATDLILSYPNGSEDAAGAASSTKYAFESGVIRLNQRDFDLWKASYTHLDVAAELLAITEWAGQQKSWFNAVKGALAKKNRDVKAAKDRHAQDGGFKWNGIEGVL